MNDICSCKKHFRDAEDFRDHLPCPGSEIEQLQAENKELKKIAKNRLNLYAGVQENLYILQNAVKAVLDDGWCERKQRWDAVPFDDLENLQMAYKKSLHGFVENEKCCNEISKIPKRDDALSPKSVQAFGACGEPSPFDGIGCLSQGYHFRHSWENTPSEAIYSMANNSSISIESFLAKFYGHDDGKTRAAIIQAFDKGEIEWADNGQTFTRKCKDCEASVFFGECPTHNGSKNCSKCSNYNNGIDNE